MELKKCNEEVKLKTPVFDIVEKSFENITFKLVGLNCNDWVMIIAYDDTTNETVLVKQTRWGIESTTLEFPCGTVENDEEPRQAALREFREETGITLNDNDLVWDNSFNPNPAYFNNKMHVYHIKVDNLREIFNNRDSLKLDENEDCIPGIYDYYSVSDDLMKGAMSLIGYHILLLLH